MASPAIVLGRGSLPNEETTLLVPQNTAKDKKKKAKKTKSSHGHSHAEEKDAFSDFDVRSGGESEASHSHSHSHNAVSLNDSLDSEAAEPPSAWCACFSRTAAREMSHEDRLKLTWLEKWRRHGRFPWKLLVNTIITILISVSVSVQSGQDTPYYVSTTVAFYQGFLPEAFDTTGTEQQGN
jgi:hypothetical protein